MNEIRYVPLSAEFAQPIEDLLRICFPDMPDEDIYTAEELVEMAEVFPMGTVVALDGDRVVGMGAGIFVDLDFENLPATENKLLNDEDDEINHDPQGDYYYGSDLGVHPDYRGRGIAREIYNWRKKIVTDHGKKGFAAAAVLPGYANYWDDLTIHDYVDKVIANELFDATLSVQLRNGFRVVRLLHEFYTFPRSKNWSALILWENPELIKP